MYFQMSYGTKDLENDCRCFACVCLFTEDEKPFYETTFFALHVFRIYFQICPTLPATFCSGFHLLFNVDLLDEGSSPLGIHKNNKTKIQYDSNYKIPTHATITCQCNHQDRHRKFQPYSEIYMREYSSAFCRTVWALHQCLHQYLGKMDGSCSNGGNQSPALGPETDINQQIRPAGSAPSSLQRMVCTADLDSFRSAWQHHQ